MLWSRKSRLLAAVALGATCASGGASFAAAPQRHTGTGTVTGTVALSPHAPALRASQLHDRAAVLAHLEPGLAASGRLVVRGDVAAQGSLSKSTPKAGAGTMPDVTGDGLEDALQINFVQRRFTARDGHTGRVLWTLPEPNAYLAQYARLGSPARPALVVQTFTVDATGLDHAGVAALDARTGKTLWAYDQRALGGDAVVAYADAAEVFTAGVLERSTGADDVLVGVASDVGSLVAGASSLAPQVVAGATGTAGTLGQPIVSDGYPLLYPLPDLDGDRVPDYVLTSVGSLDQVSVRNGATGRELWQVTAPDTGAFWSYAVALPNAVAPGKPGLLVIDSGFDGGGVTAYDGAKGTALWTVAASDALLLGDVDRDGVSEVALVEFGGSGFTFRAVSGRTAKPRWSATVSGPAQGSASIGGGPAGDLDGDHVQDLLFGINVYGRHPLEQQVVVSGSTGRQQVRTGLFGDPLYAPLSSRGDALVDLDPTASGVTVSARDLRRRLWAVRLPLHGIEAVSFLDHGRMSRGGQDVLLSAYGSGGSDIVALDGRTGALMWRTHVS